jgi:hypothetical protein
MEHVSHREQITEVINKLFVYTDERHWKKLLDEVFTDNVLFDMSSMGAGEARMMHSEEICTNWKTGFEDIDVVNHLSGNYLININGERANVFAYATATHFKSSAKLGTTRQFVGTYNLHLVHNPRGWRIDSFKYNLRFSTGNLDLK